MSDGQVNPFTNISTDWPRSNGQSSLLGGHSSCNGGRGKTSSHEFPQLTSDLSLQLIFQRINEEVYK